MTSSGQLRDISIDRLVDLLNLERDPKSRDDTSSFNVKCPFCNDKKYHMNINRDKKCYHCVLCSDDDRNTGMLDLYSRVKFGKRHIPGRAGNGKELTQSLLRDLNEPNTSDNISAEIQQKKREQVPSSSVACDENLHNAFSTLLSFPDFTLSDKHKSDLLKRGLNEAQIESNGYRTIPGDLGWIEKYPKCIHLWKSENLNAERIKYPKLKRTSESAAIADFIVGQWLCKKGVDLKGVPGAYVLGKRWAFNLQPGLLIPTRNVNGLIVCLQVRKDEGKLRYMTISSKSLLYGVTEGISRLHFPLMNVGPSNDVDVILTEGPLKADVAQSLYGKSSYFIAIQGVNNTKGLNDVLKFLKACDVTTVYNALDMDKLCNPNVRKASKSIRTKIQNAGMKCKTLCWDAEYAEEKYKELKKLCVANSIQIAKQKDVFTAIAKMSEMLTYKGIPHCENKDYWNPDSKGIDDWLRSSESNL